MPIVREHFRVLPYEEVGKALATVEASTASLSSRLCIRYLVLTAARSGEARGTRLDEIKNLRIEGPLSALILGW